MTPLIILSVFIVLGIAAIFYFVTNPPANAQPTPEPTPAPVDVPPEPTPVLIAEPVAAEPGPVLGEPAAPKKKVAKKKKKNK